MIWGLDFSMFRFFREAAGLSQEELADLSGVTQAKISKIENGKANPEVATLRALCSALDLEMILVPRRISGNVQTMIDRHVNRSVAVPTVVMSVRDELFIPDPDCED